MDWKNKIAVITGASTGIGKSTKNLLRSKGCIVYNLDINHPTEEDLHFILCDVSKKENVNDSIFFLQTPVFIYLLRWKKLPMNS